MSEIEKDKTYRVKINIGAGVSQDFGFGKWPATKSGEDVDPDMIFDGQWNGSWWDCVADGFGRKGKYGNGSIFVKSKDGVTIVNQCPCCGHTP